MVSIGKPAVTARPLSLQEVLACRFLFCFIRITLLYIT